MQNTSITVQIKINSFAQNMNILVPMVDPPDISPCKIFVPPSSHSSH